MKKSRIVTIVVTDRGDFDVMIVGRKKKGRYRAACFYRLDSDNQPRTLEQVKAWVRSQPHLTLQES